MQVKVSTGLLCVHQPTASAAIMGHAAGASGEAAKDSIVAGAGARQGSHFVPASAGPLLFGDVP